MGAAPAITAPRLAGKGMLEPHPLVALFGVAERLGAVRVRAEVVGTAASGKRREASVTLIAGQTNRMSVQLEPRERSTIKHY